MVTEPEAGVWARSLAWVWSRARRLWILESLRDLYVNLTGREPTPEELAEARVKLDKAKAEDSAKTKP
jgi:hypothetical protein